MMVSLFRTRATAAEPVPAMMSPPSAPAWAPTQAVVASFAARMGKKLRKSRCDSRLVAVALEPGQPQAHRDRSGVGLIEPGVYQGRIDKRPQGACRRSEIDMDIRRGSGRLGEQLSVRVAQSGPGTGGAAVDAEGRARDSRSLDRLRQVHHRSRCDAERLRRLGRRHPLRAGAGRRLLRRHRQMDKDGGDRQPLVA